MVALGLGLYRMFLVQSFIGLHCIVFLPDLNFFVLLVIERKGLAHFVQTYAPLMHSRTLYALLMHPHTYYAPYTHPLCTHAPFMHLLTIYTPCMHRLCTHASYAHLITLYVSMHPLRILYAPNHLLRTQSPLTHPITLYSPLPMLQIFYFWGSFQGIYVNNQLGERRYNDVHNFTAIIKVRNHVEIVKHIRTALTPRQK